MTAPLVCRDLTRRFDADVGVDGIDLEVRDGEIHAVVGLNGAGKTTLMRLLLRMLSADEGRAEIYGQDVGTVPASLWRRVGHLIDAPLAYAELTVTENLEASALLHGMARSTITQTVQATVERFDLTQWANKRARVLSSGNRQRLGLAAAVLHGPSLLILDEPASALDPAGVVFIREELRSFAAGGNAVFLSSHHLDELARVADRITVMHRGRIVGSLDPRGVDLERTFFEMVHETDVAARGDRP